MAEIFVFLSEVVSIQPKFMQKQETVVAEIVISRDSV